MTMAVAAENPPTKTIAVRAPAALLERQGEHEQVGIGYVGEQSPAASRGMTAIEVISR